MKKEHMTNLHEAMNDMGITTNKFRVKLTEKEIISKYSDWVYLHIEIYAPNKKKPCQHRKLAFNFVRGIIDWDKSSFTNL